MRSLRQKQASLLGRPKESSHASSEDSEDDTQALLWQYNLARQSHELAMQLEPAPTVLYRAAQMLTECNPQALAYINVQQLVLEISRDFLLSTTELFLWVSHLKPQLKRHFS